MTIEISKEKPMKTNEIQQIKNMQTLTVAPKMTMVLNQQLNRQLSHRQCQSKTKKISLNFKTKE